MGEGKDWEGFGSMLWFGSDRSLFRVGESWALALLNTKGARKCNPPREINSMLKVVGMFSSFCLMISSISVIHTLQWAWEGEKMFQGHSFLVL